ncbi:MAG: hypothetical protein QNK03_14730 [Myxococcota bacterium]|nr:hypothetical protein [Myxococcota bacterium]
MCPLWSRLFERAPLSPPAVAALFALALFALFLAADAADGNLATLLGGSVPVWLHVEVRSALVCAVLFAAMIWTHRNEEQGTRTDLEQLRVLLEPGSRAAGALREAGRVPSGPALRLAGAAGALVIAAIIPALYLEPSRFLRGATYLRPSVLLDLGLGAAFGWAMFRTLYAAIVQDRAFAQLADHVREIDLLDLAPLRPFARRGLRRALRWLMLVSLSSFVFLDAGFVEPPAVVVTGVLGFAAFSFLLPVLRVHRRIRDEKQAQLRALREDIREHERMHGAGTGGAPAGRLSDLLSWELRLESVREWPIDPSTLLRFLLVLLLPIGSWLGGAFVERAVSAWLD